ncbi:MAG: class I tRNA ligase family protein [Patescibacteria group bacterium]
MHKKFDSGEIEKKWQAIWKESGIYNVGERDRSKPKSYVLVEWPYPSGNLHIGHWYAFAVPDIYARYKRMSGHQVLYPIGFDAFGLPAENAAIKRNLNPKDWTYENMAFMREQLERMGNMFSWDKTTNSTDQDYYKWTQWMFTQFFEKSIAYRGKGIVNWCPGCNTAVANEQVLTDGTCERSGDVIEKREMPQWMMKITDYADRLIDDLDTVAWPDHIKEAQRQWIGRSKGAKINFTLSTGDVVTVFTTRPDTLFGATYLVLAPEHPLLSKSEVRGETSNLADVDAYVKTATQKDEQDRLDATKEKTGVVLSGITATNPASGEQIPVYVADYVLGGYGTGAIMAVPAHDERDYAFATKFGLPIKQVIVPCADDSKNPPRPEFKEVKRDTVIIHLRDKSTGKFALLNWHGTLEGITTAIMGGIENGQTPEEAALAEMNEEAALNRVTIVSKLKWITAAKYCASHKQQNRCAHTYAFLGEVENLNEQGVIPESESAIHTLVWVDEKEVLAKLTPDHQKQVWQMLQKESAITGDGYLINSDEFDGMDSEEAKEKIVAKVGGEMTSTFRLRDWSIGRQRYWGVPIPIVYSPTGEAHIVPKEHLPWVLPEDVDFKPTGVAPLAKSEALKKRTEEIFGSGWTPEVETMDTFVDSSWYFLRYLDNKNEGGLASLEAQKEWMPIDMYFGGAEHTTMHLLYSRFWQKALFDLGLVTESEPYKQRVNHGMILGPDGNKMSKSKGNVVDPDAQVALVGADTVKIYLAFMGPYADSSYPWDFGGIAGVRRFLERVYGLVDHIGDSEPTELTRQLHKTIAKVGTDILEFKYNTAISAMMILVNLAEKGSITKASYELFVRILAPFAPHLTEEIWTQLGHTCSVHTETFPVADMTLAIDETVVIGVQINGKLRGNITIAPDATEGEALNAVQDNPLLQEKLLSGTLKKVIYVPGRILNLLLQ